MRARSGISSDVQGIGTLLTVARHGAVDVAGQLDESGSKP
jgi:hypothetical protein